MNLPIFLTCIRLVLAPVFLFLYLSYNTIGISPTALPYILLSIVIVAETTDFYDGHFARLYKQVTVLGQVLDPMSDSLYHISLFLTFTQPPVQIPIFLVMVFLYREIMISGLRIICAICGFTLSARRSGKIKSVVQGISIIIVLLLLIPHSLGMMSNETLYIFSTVSVTIAAIYTLLSGADYLYANRAYIAQGLKYL